MQIDCNVAKTKVVQTLTNHGDISIPEAFYSFPLYDGATVTAFRCEVGDDKVLEGMMKPTDEAKRTTIGNIPPRTDVKVEITYVEELHTDLSGEAVRKTGLSLVVSIASQSPFGAIVCRSGHEICVEYGNMSHLPEAASFETLAQLQRQENSGLNTKHATARLSNNQTSMNGDFILFIPYSDGILKPRALLAPSSGSDHAAMMVTAVAVDIDDKWIEAVIRMLKGAVMSTSWSYSIEFEGLWKEKRLDVDDFFGRHSEKRVSEALVHTPGSVNPSFVRAPRRIPWLHHFGQQSVYFLLETIGEKLPESVVITACSQYGGTKTATLAVTQIPSSGTTIRQLAAKAAVRDLEAKDMSEVPSPNKIHENAEKLSDQSPKYEDVEVSVYRAPLAELDLLTRPGVSQAGANFGSSAGLRTIAGPGPRRGGIGPIMQRSSTSLPPFPEGRLRLKPSRRASKASEIVDERIDGYRPKGGSCRRPSKKSVDGGPHQLTVKRRSAAPLSKRTVKRFFDDLLEKRLGYYMAQHFCHGTRRALRGWLMKHVQRPVAVWLLVDTVLALAYIRSHFYSQRGLWDLLARKAEGTLASHLTLGAWAEPDGVSAIADSGLAHAHYGRWSQTSGQSSWWTHGPSSGRCGVCNPQREEWLSSVTHDDGFKKCSVSRCDVSVGKWDEFWAHAIEKGHIYSSCEAASIRYSVAIVKAREAI
ncbi:hypothetical protein LA080_006802 [Diaporthe eres]|nr:hypothetical protein LA080_006802 [Diaporthe eres]